jgi:hypothetical protein
MTTPNRPLRISKALIFAAALFVASIIPASAHHSLAAGFDINKILTVSGAITEMKWTNPHSWLSIDVKDEKTG